VVREIDALGGIMAGDRSRDDPVQDAQSFQGSRRLGAAAPSATARCTAGPCVAAEGFAAWSFTQGMVTRLLTDGARVSGVVTADGRSFQARAVCSPPGNLPPRPHPPWRRHPDSGGRAGDQPAVDIDATH